MAINIYTPDDVDSVNNSIKKMEELYYYSSVDISKSGVLTYDGIIRIVKSRKLVRIIIAPDGAKLGQGTKCTLASHNPNENIIHFEQRIREEKDITEFIRNLIKILSSTRYETELGDSLLFYK